MKIGFDIRPLLSRETGVGVYFKNLLNSLAETDKDNRYLLLSSSFKERINRNHLPRFNDFVLKDVKIPVKILNYLWFNLSFPPFEYIFGELPDITHSPNPLFIPGKGKKIITVHDLAFIDNPSLTAKEARKYFLKRFANSLKKADGIISVSLFTKERILNLFGNRLDKKIKVIYHGSDMNDVASSRPGGFNIPEKFILFTGSLEPRKNLSTLIKAFSLFNRNNRDIKLVLAGTTDARSIPVMRLISLLKLEDDVLITGYLKRGEIKYLLENTDFLVFPSLYEGFGLPVLEAASLGKPSIVSDIPVFREIFGDYPSYFNRNSPEELNEKIEEMYRDSDKRKSLSKKGKNISKNFSWERAANETLDFYKEVKD